MHGKGFVIKILFGIALLLNLNCSQISAEISDFYSLKQALEAPGEATIQLITDIDMTEAIYVNGKKNLDGNGHVLRRGKEGGNFYKGTLFLVKDAELEVKEVTISGEGVGAEVVKNSWGRLIDVQQGRVVLGIESTLTKNKNEKENSDGGGAVLVRKGGTLQMNAGSIVDNQNVVGGAGIRVEEDGTFLMTGGKIVRNQVNGIGEVEGFDGRGGAICNYGKVIIEGGEIRGNKVKGYTYANVSYGGVGGALYNRGECRILGGTMIGNQASFGGGAIYTDDKSVLRIQGGIIKGNKAREKKNLYLAGGTWELSKQKEADVKTKTRKESVKKDKRVFRKKDKRNEEEKTKNKENKIVIRTAPRYLFTGEVETYTEKDWKRELLSGCYIKWNGVEKSEDSLYWNWGGLLKNKEGTYQVTIVPIMGKKARISVSLVQEKKMEEDEKGYIRFLPVDGTKQEVEEIWQFDSEQLRDIKKYMKNQADPFSVGANKGFLVRFIKCCKKGGS